VLCCAPRLSLSLSRAPLASFAPQTELLAKFYGQSAISNGPAATSGGVAGGGNQIIESTAMLKLQQQQLVATTAALAQSAAVQVATQPQGVTQDNTTEAAVTSGSNSKSILPSGIVHPQVRWRVTLCSVL